MSYKASVMKQVNQNILNELKSSGRTPEASAEAVKTLVTETMVSEMQNLFPEVPIGVEAKVCTNWGGKSA